MQVKEYLQALSDDGKIRVEKIGSGNWYWSFVSEEKQNKENALAKLQEEKMKLDTKISEMKGEILRRKESNGEEGEKTQLAEALEGVKVEVEALKVELAGYRDNDPTEVLKKREETNALKAQAEMWTDNIYVLEGRLTEMAGGDRELLEAIQRECYGREYVEGEGLRELV